jgi:hypothetical protein
MNTPCVNVRAVARRLLQGLILLSVAGILAFFSPRNTAPYVGSMLALTLVGYVVWAARLPLVAAFSIFLIVSLSPLDVDLQGSGGQMRILSVSSGLPSGKLTTETWQMGCFVGLNDPWWMLTWRSQRTKRQDPSLL